MRNICAIRCKATDDYAKDVFNRMQETNFFDDIKYFQDNYGSREGSLDLDFLEKYSLRYFGERTGWVCGDYVLYKALDYEWDYLWIVEPDILFPQNFSSWLRENGGSSEDLICVGYKEAREDWNWTKVIRPLISSDTTIYQMKFPFFRVSRRLVEESLKLRIETTKKIPETVLDIVTEVPNDEGILATAAFSGGFSVKILEGNTFKYFNTGNYKYLQKLFSKNINFIVHPYTRDRRIFLDNLYRVGAELRREKFRKEKLIEAILYLWNIKNISERRFYIKVLKNFLSGILKG